MARILRKIRRLWTRLGSRRIHLVYTGRYVVELPGLPQDPRRGENILTFLHLEGLLRRGDLHWPREATIQALARVHSAEYLAAAFEPGGLERIVGFAVPPADEARFFSLQRAMTGGTLRAARLSLADGRPAVNLGGGLHHAHRDRGQGFCAFNDLAVTIAQLRADGFDGKILVIDLDLHDGDGTRSLFADDPTVHTLSIHNQTWAEPESVEAAVADTTVALGDDVEDATYLEAVRRHVPRALRHHEPDLVFYLAGVDPAATDTLGNWSISPRGLLDRDRFVTEAVRRLAGNPPLVVVLAGGYGGESWRYTARFLGCWLPRGRRIEPPSTSEVTFRRYRAIAHYLRPEELTGIDEDDDNFGISASDVLPGLGTGASPTHLLGYYSIHGVEVALERYGLLPRIRALGFPRPTLEFDLDHPAGETMRVFTGPDQTAVLCEARVRRDRTLLPGRELLFVEWLLLQNPRAAFPPERPPLPGQKHPGLGLLREVVALFVMVCHRLKLDGLAFVPSQFHLAAQSEGSMTFVSAEDTARFRSLKELFGEVPLAEASRRLARGEVLDRATGEPFAWSVGPMVVPISDDLRKELSSRAFEERVRGIQDGLALELAHPAVADGRETVAAAGNLNAHGT